MKSSEALKKYHLIPSRYENKGKVQIVTTNKGKFVYKDSGVNKKILNYLKSRNFGYFPSIINDINDDYRIFDYVEDLDIPKEQKILDMINLVALLHSKTTHYKEVDLGDYDKLYDQIDNNIEYLYSYYTDLITIIESKVYMSPSEYLLARNINVIYEAIDNCKKRLERWHSLVLKKEKMRNTVIHGNLNLAHFIRNKNSYLISWDKARIDSPVFDLYKLYKSHALDLDFSEIFFTYEKTYPLTEDERQLLFLLISLQGNMFQLVH